MKELVEIMAKALVSNPDQVTVVENTVGDETTLLLSVDPADVGKVIGKQGRIAKALRAVLKAAASRKNVKVILDIQ
ncbi:MAG: KH domain-containing protein [Lachnospiraceae bacterium]|nr:KH domain-containing protein [Lachnospiraceae bacterium]